MHCPDTPDDWERVKKFRTRWNVPHTVGATDRKHIAMKKPKKSDIDYYNYKGFLPGSPGPGQCRIQIPVDKLWVKWFLLRYTDFQQSDLREKIEEGGPYLHCFLLDDDAFALMPWIMKPYSRRQLTREERIANYRIFRGRRVIENAFGVLLSHFRVLLGTMEQGPRVVRDIVFMCVVLHNMLRTPARSKQGTNPNKWCSGPTK